MKKVLLIAILILGFTHLYSSDKARGMFLTLGLGPKVPIGDFSSRVLLGYGFELEMCYTDNEYIPMFLFGRIGFMQFPGSHEFYQASDYSNYATNLLPLEIGARYFAPPILENIILILPILEVSGSLAIYQNLHEFKIGTNRNNYIEDGSKLGFCLGAGVSMFLIEAVASYHWYEDNQYLSFDLKLRLPMFVSL